MKIRQVKISDIISAEYNPRTLTTTQHKHLEDSLKRFGFVDPVIINTHNDRKNILVGGHQRVKVWSAMGNDTVPAVTVELDRDRERELNVRLNKNTGEWDIPTLLSEFDNEELLDWGWAQDELDALEAEVATIDRMDGDQAGASPWDRIGDATEGVVFAFGATHKKLPTDIYERFAAQVSSANLEEWLCEAIGN